MRVVLHMVMGFVIMILFAQLWLFTVTLDAMENQDTSVKVVLVALICSLVGCGAVWALLRLFLRAEENQ
jgi:formate/nitrite transporter FocA (FNT family)